MDFFENRYFNTIRVSLSVIGLWPYQNMRQKVAIQLILTILIGSLAVLVFWKITTLHVTMWFVAYSFQYIVLGLMFATNLIYGWTCVRKLRLLLDHIKCDWNLFEPCDVEIIEPYAELGRKFTIASTVLCALLPFLVFLEAKRPNHALNPNVTVDSDIIQTFLPFEILGINYEKSFTSVVAALIAIAFLGFVTTLGLATLYLSSVLHACGMFSIAGRRMESMLNDLQEDIFFYKKKVILLVFQSIMLHARAVNFVNTVNSFYGPLYFVKVVLVIILLSIDILQMTHSFDLHDTKKLVINIFHFCIILTLTAVFCYTGQTLLDYSNDIFFKIYSSQWYVAPVNMQKLVIIIMARCLKESGIMFTKSITSSFEMLLTILQMVLSYFMAINSLQEK